jgi:hypothetical protein
LQMVFLRHGDAVIERKANNFERESNWTNEREIDGLILVQVDYDKNGWMVRSKVEKKLVHYRPILQWVQAKRILDWIYNEVWYTPFSTIYSNNMVWMNWIYN